MKRNLAIILFFVMLVVIIIPLVSADSIQITPENPTTNSSINITFSGYFPNLCFSMGPSFFSRYEILARICLLSVSNFCSQFRCDIIIYNTFYRCNI